MDRRSLGECAVSRFDRNHRPALRFRSRSEVTVGTKSLKRHFVAKAACSLIVLSFVVGLFQAGAFARNQAAPEPKYKVGETAPDFTLKDQNGSNVSLHDFRGKKNVVLAFFIFAFSGG